MTRLEIASVKTKDGVCSTHLYFPDVQAKSAVLMFSDAGGIRPATLEMGERLAQAGYLAVIPDIYYRYGAYGPLVPKDVFAGDAKAILGPLMATTNVTKAVEDTGAILNYLDERGDVPRRPMGVVGFCMGGGMAIAAAASYPDRFAAVASFHGGNLATDSPKSPHLFVPLLEAELYIASAENDETYPPDMAERLEEQLDKAGVRYVAELYTGARHGWMVPDFPSHDPELAEAGWNALARVFRRNLQE